MDNHIVLFILYFLFLCLNQIFSRNIEIEMPKTILLPSGDYFIISSNGIIVYSYDFRVNKTIYNFNENEKEYYNNNKIVISQYSPNNEFYIFCLIKGESLLFFDYKNCSIKNIEITGISKKEEYYYNIIPYKLNNNSLEYIITYISFFNAANSGYYQINFFRFKISSLENIQDNILISNNTFSIVGKPDNTELFYDYELNLRCQIIYSNLPKLICFYSSDSFTKLVGTSFDIENNFIKINSSEYEYINEYIDDIKSSSSNYDTKIFVCTSLDLLNNNAFLYNETICFLFDIINYTFEIKYKDDYNNFITNYFKESNEYVLIGFINVNDYYYTYNNHNNSIKIVRFKIEFNNDIIENKINIYNCINMKSFSLIYNNYNKGYDLISDCPNMINEENFIANNSQIINIEDFSFSFNSPIICTILNSDTNIFESSTITSFSYYSSTESSLLFNYSFINESLSNIYKINSNIIEFLNNNITQLLNKIEIGKIYDVKGEDFNLIIKPTNLSYFENSTQINFIECENILRKELNISSSRILTLLQIEIYNKNDKSLINKVEYQAYDDNKNALDLSKCDNTNIQIDYLIKNNNSLNYSSISFYKDIGVDILNINDSFFNDICKPFSDSKNDLVLEDRIKDIYQNYSLCEDGCIYIGVNLEYKTISCICNIKNNISLNESFLEIKQFNEINIESNFRIIKCYKLVFSLNGKLKNIGFWIFSIFILIHIPLVFFYFYKEIKSINEYIINEMIKSGYLKKEINKKNMRKRKKKITSKKDILNLNQKSKKINKDEDKYNHLKSNDVSYINNSNQLMARKIIKYKTFKCTNKSKKEKNLKKK